MYITEKAKERVLALIKDTEGCIEYPFINHNGYGEIQGYDENHRKLHMLAHRVAYQVTTGDIISSEDLICHHCDNPKCINPKHLFKGTNKDNSDDKCRKGRQAKGVIHGKYIDGRASDWQVHRGKSRGVLSISQIMEARILRANGTKLKEIADILNIPYQTVRDINCGRVYKDIK